MLRFTRLALIPLDQATKRKGIFLQVPNKRGFCSYTVQPHCLLLLLLLTYWRQLLPLPWHSSTDQHHTAQQPSSRGFSSRLVLSQQPHFKLFLLILSQTHTSSFHKASPGAFFVASCLIRSSQHLFSPL